MTKPTYQVVCFTCYTCIVCETKSKKDANIAAVGHMNAYGHKTAIQTKG